MAFTRVEMTLESIESFHSEREEIAVVFSLSQCYVKQFIDLQEMWCNANL